MLIVAGTVEIAREDLQAIRAAARAMTVATRAEAGCLDYAFSVEIGESDDVRTVRIFERWKDVAAFQSHFGSAHMADFNDALAGVDTQSMDIRVYSGAEEHSIQDFLSG